MSAVAKLYMKLTGKSQGAIEGDSTTVHFAGQIEIDDWSWSVETTPGTPASSEIVVPSADRPKFPGGSGLSVNTRVGGTDEITPSVFGFSKLMDRATTNLLSAMRTGELLEAEISLQEMSRDTFELKVYLSEIRVIDYAVNGKNDKASGEIDESWKFNYSRIRFEFKPAARVKGRASGVMTADAVRRPGASMRSSETPRDEMVKLAARITEAEWPALMQAFEKQRASLQNAPSDKQPTS